MKKTRVFKFQGVNSNITGSNEKIIVFYFEEETNEVTIYLTENIIHLNFQDFENFRITKSSCAKQDLYYVVTLFENEDYFFRLDFPGNINHLKLTHSLGFMIDVKKGRREYYRVLKKRKFYEFIEPFMKTIYPNA